MSHIVAAAGGGPGSKWNTALDIDFTAMPTQALTLDGDYTIGDVTWTKFNSANEATPAVVTNGVGLVLRPAAATNFSAGVRTIPGIRTSLAALIPNYVLDTRMRVWLYMVSANLAADYDSVILAVENPTTDTNTAAYHYYYNSEKARARFMFNGGDNDFTLWPWPAVNLFMIEIFGTAMTSMQFTGTYAGGWPAVDTLAPFALRGLGAGTAFTTAVPFGLPSGHYLMIGAGRGGSGTALTATFGAVRLDYLS